MAAKEGSRIFVGGLSPDVTERDLERAFSRFGDILDCQVRTFSSLFSVCARLHSDFFFFFPFLDDFIILCLHYSAGYF